MIVVGENLSSLISQHKIVENVNECYDETSIALSLDNNITDIIPTGDMTFVYGNELPLEWIKERCLNNDEFLTLGPGESALGCSHERVNIPVGYFGILQTKGSLARLFVTIHCCDAQIEPGFSGKITFEIVNFSKMTIKIRPKEKIGALFLFKTSTNIVKPYNGRYNNSDKPTIQKKI
ncbi:hypothetical protein [Parapedobacter sp. 2B3]|uniref:dCTP deaminase n=1 Tax=Parapedobacter sp. 2B3 TaxID=3342381 RepID=UPI0035B5E63F